VVSLDTIPPSSESLGYHGSIQFLLRRNHTSIRFAHLGILRYSMQRSVQRSATMVRYNSSFVGIILRYALHISVYFVTSRYTSLLDATLDAALSTTLGYRGSVYSDFVRIILRYALHISVYFVTRCSARYNARLPWFGILRLCQNHTLICSDYIRSYLSI